MDTTTWLKFQPPNAVFSSDPQPQSQFWMSKYLIVISSVKYCRREVNIYVDCYGIIEILLWIFWSSKHIEMFEYRQRHHRASTTCQKFANFRQRITKWQPAKLHLPCKLHNNGPWLRCSWDPSHASGSSLFWSSLQYVDCMLYRVSLLDDWLRKHILFRLD